MPEPDGIAPDRQPVTPAPDDRLLGSTARALGIILAAVAIFLLATDKGPQGTVIWHLGQHHGIHIGDFFEFGLLLLAAALFWATRKRPS
jgi:hypothetical protein